MRILVAAVVLVVTAVVGLPAQQSSPKLRPDLANFRVARMLFADATLADVLQALGTAAGVTIQIAPEASGVVKNTKIATLKFRNTVFADTLAAIIMSYGLTSNVIDEKTVMVTLRAK